MGEHLDGCRVVVLVEGIVHQLGQQVGRDPDRGVVAVAVELSRELTVQTDRTDRWGEQQQQQVQEDKQQQRVKEQ